MLASTASQNINGIVSKIHAKAIKRNELRVNTLTMNIRLMCFTVTKYRPCTYLDNAPNTSSISKKIPMKEPWLNCLDRSCDAACTSTNPLLLNTPTRKNAMKNFELFNLEYSFRVIWSLSSSPPSKHSVSPTKLSSSLLVSDLLLIYSLLNWEPSLFREKLVVSIMIIIFELFCKY